MPLDQQFGHAYGEIDVRRPAPKERPIIFNGAMVRAILDGRKTQTRRLIRPQPTDFANSYEYYDDMDGDTSEYYNVEPGEWAFWAYHAVGDYGGSPYETDLDLIVKCPYGTIGDHLYVRETWCKMPSGTYVYRASMKSEFKPSWGNWKPSIHMPKEAARIWLEIVDVRVERVQEISEEDAVLEGVQGDECLSWGIDQATPKMCFNALWDSIYGAQGFGWDTNPWVWVIEFKRIEK